MLNKIKNFLFRKKMKNQSGVCQPKIYRKRIGYVITYNRGGDDWNTCTYKSSNIIETTDAKEFVDDVEYTKSIYSKKINELKIKLNDNSCRYISIDNELVISKKDFVSVYLINENID